MNSLSDSAQKNLIHSFAGPGIDLRNQFCNFSWKRAVKTPFFKLFNSKAKDFERYGMKVFQPNDYDDVTSRHGPAYTLHLEWICGELYNGLRISVDLALAFKTNSKPSKVNLDFECPSGRVLKPLFDSLPHFFAVSSYRDVLNESNQISSQKPTQKKPPVYRRVISLCVVPNHPLSRCYFFKNLAQTVVKANA